MSGGPWGSVDDEESLIFWFYVVMVLMSVGFDFCVKLINKRLISLADRRDRKDKEVSMRLIAIVKPYVHEGSTSERSSAHEDHITHEELHEMEEHVHQKNEYDGGIHVWNRCSLLCS